MDQTPSFEKEQNMEEEGQKEDPAELKRKQLLQRVQGLIDTTSSCVFDYICQASTLAHLPLFTPEAALLLSPQQC